jgi:hypothetical protein
VAFGANAFSNQPNAQFQWGGSPYAFQNAQIASVQQQAGSCCIPQFQGNVMFGGNGSTAGQAPPCASAGYPQTTQQSMRSGGAQFSTPLGGGHPMGTSMGTQNPSVPGSFGSQQQFSGVSAFGGSSEDILAKAQKVKVAKIKRGSTDEAQNSHMRFNASLRSCGVLKKLKDGTLAVEEEEAVADLVMRWIGDDEEVVSQTRYVLGADCEIGSKMYALVVQYFIDPVNNEATDAEDDLQSFKWSAVVGAADGAALLVELNKLWAIVGKLDPSRRSEPAFWVKYVKARLPTALLNAYQLHVQSFEPREMVMATVDHHAFGRALAQSRNSMVMRAKMGVDSMIMRPKMGVELDTYSSPGQFNAHQESRTEQPPRRRKCKKCDNWSCPRAKVEEATCDITGHPSSARVAEIASMGGYRLQVSKQRHEKGMPALKFAQVASHALELEDEDDDDARMRLDAESFEASEQESEARRSMQHRLQVELEQDLAQYESALEAGGL